MGLKYGDFTFEVSRQCGGMARLLFPAKTAGEIAGRFDRGLPVYSTVFYSKFGRVLKYREIRDFEKKVSLIPRLFEFCMSYWKKGADINRKSYN